MKKASISLLLIISMLFLSVSLTACEKGKKVTSIDGKLPNEAFANAVAAIDESKNFSIKLSLDAEVNVLFIPVHNVEVDDFCTYLYNGDDQYFEISDTAISTLKEKDLSYVIEGYDDAIWYVDGICYVKNDDTKEKYKASSSPIAENPYITAITKVVDEKENELQCYVDDDKYYFTVEIKDASLTKMGMGAEKELYRVYFNPDGTLDKIHVECTVKTLGLIKFDATYSSGTVSEITPPSDADSYLE